MRDRSRRDPGRFRPRRAVGILPLVNLPPSGGTIRLVRASLIVALGGHLVANLIFDEGEYVGAGAELVRHLQDPFAVQVAIVGIITAALTRWLRHRPPSVQASEARDAKRIAVLVGLQLLLFVSMEASERLLIDAIWDVPHAVEPFGDGFVQELIVALTCSAALAAVGTAAARVLSTGRQPNEVVVPDAWLQIADVGTHRSLGLSAPSVRGPPTS
jgi:hypothetical protein